MLDFCVELLCQLGVLGLGYFFSRILFPPRFPPSFLPWDHPTVPVLLILPAPYPNATVIALGPHDFPTAVRAKLRSLGPEVSPCVLDVLSQTVNTRADVAEAVLRDIHSNCELDEVSSPSACGNFSFGETGFNERFNGEEQVFVALRHFSDVYMLIHMLLSPGLAIGASEAFGKAVAQGAILDHKWPC